MLESWRVGEDYDWHLKRSFWAGIDRMSKYAFSNESRFNTSFQFDGLVPTYIKHQTL